MVVKGWLVGKEAIAVEIILVPHRQAQAPRFLGDMGTCDINMTSDNPIRTLALD
jgi:hypothetical protein